MPTRLFDTVSIKKLTLLYGGTRALAGVDLTVRAGEITSIEGPNGAGKSSLFAVLSTLTRPTSGVLRYGKLDPREDIEIIRPSIGMVAHEAMVYPDLTPRETLSMMCRAYELTRVSERVTQALNDHALTEIADRPARTFSRGQLQRLSLARALLHSPDLLLFDEPSTGLDRASVERLSEALLAARTRGQIVVMVTHDMTFASRVADRRVTLERGRVVRDEAVLRG